MEYPALTFRPPRRRRFPVAIAVLIALTAAMPAAAQERSPYFSLNTSGTVRSGDSPVVRVNASDVDSLEFRVYKVNDPVEFFRSLEDLHNFGGQARQLPRDQTPIERFHQLKVRLRSRFQNVFRSQYSDDSRARIREWREARNRPPAQQPAAGGERGQVYPTVPLLNPQQVVNVWRENFSQVQRWETRNIKLQVPGKGLYLVEATDGQLRAYTIALVTDIAVVTKGAPGRLLSYVANRNTGVPIGNSSLWILSDGKDLGQTTTGANGINDSPLKEAKPENVLVLARHGDDFAANALYAWSLSTDPARNLMGYVYSDRPVYRPGHTVYFKGILRTQAPSGYQLISNRELQAEIQDPESNAVYRKTLPVSPNGTVNGEFDLPATALLGYYSINLRAGEASATGGFHVEEYRKPEYEVKVAPEVARVLQGDKITARIEARYYFGEPVAFGKVKYVVHTTPYWFYPRDEEFEGEGESEGEYDDYAQAQIDEQTAQLDAEGRVTVSIPTLVSEQKRDVRYRIEARVTDGANREISGRGYVIATYGSFVLNVQTSNYVAQTGSTQTFTIEAKDYDNRPVETNVRLALRQYIRDGKSEQPVFTAEARTDSAGQALIQAPVRGAGSFTATATAETPEQREVSDQTWFWVTGEDTPWVSRRGQSIEIVPDKTSYRPGEVAKVLIATGMPDTHVLVTTEGKEISSYQLTPVSDTSFTVDVPIRSEFAPNFFLGVVFLKNDKLYQGLKSIKVPPVEHELTIDVQPSKPQFKPGEPATYSIMTRDHAGQPVSAEVSVGIVDEAVYAVRPEAARDIKKFFYGNNYNRTTTTSSLNYYFYGSAGRRQMRLTELRPTTALGQLKPENLVEARVRKAFPDTALWLANVKTDSNGRGEVRLDFPDALTTWRATARAVTGDTKVGSTIQQTIVRKDLILRLSLPRFFTEGDIVTVSALVHNYLESEKKALVSLAVQGLDVVEGSTREVVVPSRGDARVDWKVRAGAKAEAKLLGKALTDEESDAMELTLPVVPYGVKLTTSNSGALTDSSRASATVNFPPSAGAASRSIEISVAPSIGAAIFGALDYLTTFPYGCTEQTMSSFLPNVIVTRALRELKLKSNVDEAALNRKVREGLKRLYDFQHEDGGWGWWETDDSSAFMTAYVVHGLGQARDAGITVQQQSLDRGVAWLSGQFQNMTLVAPDLRAYMVYSLAAGGAADKQKLDSVWNDRSRMTPYGLTLLGLALDKAGDARAAEIAGQLETIVKTNDREAYWEAGHDWLLDFDGDSSPEATAFAIKLLMKHRPGSALLSKAALWLVGHRNEGYYWNSTKQTAMVIYGLTDYLKQSGELRPNFTASVFVDGRQVLSRTFSSKDVFELNIPPIRIPADNLASSQHEIRIEKSGAGVLYWSSRAEYFTSEEKVMQTGSVSLNVIREYFHLLPQKENDRVLHQLQPVPASLKPGDVIAVRLTISGGKWRYLLTEDPIPAGAEFIQRDDLYELREKPPWWTYYYTRREFHDNRAAFFQTDFNGQLQYYYLLKVVNPGEFRVNPTRVQPMYQPQYLSTTEIQNLLVKQ